MIQMPPIHLQEVLGISAAEFNGDVTIRRAFEYSAATTMVEQEQVHLVNVTTVSVQDIDVVVSGRLLQSQSSPMSVSNAPHKQLPGKENMLLSGTGIGVRIGFRTGFLLQDLSFINATAAYQYVTSSYNTSVTTGKLIAVFVQELLTGNVTFGPDVTISAPPVHESFTTIERTDSPTRAPTLRPSPVPTTSTAPTLRPSFVPTLRPSAQPSSGNEGIAFIFRTYGARSISNYTFRLWS